MADGKDVPTAGEWAQPQRVDEYLGREIPHRDLAEAMLVAALPERVARCADLGCGDGRLLGLVRERFPDASGIGLDSSPPMLKRAAERFAGEQGVELVEADLAQPLSLVLGGGQQTDEAGSERFDLIVSGLAIHHLEDERKRSLFAEVAALLRPGGVFANLDLVRAASPHLHERFRREIGRVEDDPSDRLADLADQLEWLRNAALTAVDCHFKWLELSLVVAEKPA
ncbi:MAG: class I SAM-dependent methyltransferase [Solirubrobacterales bacterium]